MEKRRRVEMKRKARNYQASEKEKENEKSREKDWNRKLKKETSPLYPGKNPKVGM